MGASRRSRWQRLTRGSVIGRVIRESGAGIDVHVDQPSRERSEEAFVVRARRRPATLPRRRVAARASRSPRSGCRSSTWSSPCSATRSGCRASCSSSCCSSSAVSAVGGLWPALAAAISGFLLVNWYFTPPLYTFTISEGENILALAVFLAVAGDRQRLRRARGPPGGRGRARARRGGGALRLAGSSPASTSCSRACGACSGSTAPPCCTATESGWRIEAASGDRVPGEPRGGATTIELDDDARARARRRSDPQRGSARARRVRQGARAPRSSSASSRPRRRPPARSRPPTSCAPRSSRPSRTTCARRSPRQGVGHEPAPAGRRVDARGAAASSSTTIDEETDRLNALVGNLLDMSRLQAGALEISSAPVGLEEVLPAALRSLGAADGAVDLDVSESLPRVLADPGLLERALANVIANAHPLLAAGTPGAGHGRRRRRRRRRARRRPRARACRAASASGSSSRSSGSATRRRARASGSGSRSPRDSSRRWAARSRSRTRPAAASPSSFACKAAE